MPEIPLRMNPSSFLAGAKKAQSATKRLDGSWSTFVTGMNQGLSLITTSLSTVGRIAGKVGDEIGEAFDASSEAGKLERAFVNLAGGAGKAEQMMGAMRKGSLGLVADIDLLRAGTRALGFGIIDNAEEMEQFTTTSLTLAAAAGTTATKGLDDFTTGLSRASAPILDNLMIMIAAGDSQSLYAASIGKTVKELTAAEKKEATVFAGKQAGADLSERLGGLQVTELENLQLLNVQLENNKLEMQKMTAEALGPFVGDLAEFVAQEGPGFLDFLRGSIELFKDAKQRVTGMADSFSSGFSTLKGLASAVGIPMEKVSGALGAAADRAAKASGPIGLLGSAAFSTGQKVKQSAIDIGNLGKQVEETGEATVEAAPKVDDLKAKIFGDDRGANDAFWVDLTKDIETETQSLKTSKAPDNISGAIEMGVEGGVLASQAELIDGLSGPEVTNSISRNLGLAFSRSIKKATGSDLGGLDLDDQQTGAAQETLEKLSGMGSQGGEAIVNALNSGDETFAKDVIRALEEKIENSRRFGANDAHQRRLRKEAENELMLLKKLLNTLGVTRQGFAGGSMGFQDFGRGTTVDLHGREAVVRAGGADADTVLGEGALDDLNVSARSGAASVGYLARIAAALESSGSDAIQMGRAMVDNSNARARMAPDAAFVGGA